MIEVIEGEPFSCNNRTYVLHSGKLFVHNKRFKHTVMPWDRDAAHTRLSDGRIVLRGSEAEAEEIMRINAIKIGDSK